MIPSLRKVSLGQTVFLSGVFFVLALGVYLISFGGVDIGWIGKIMIGAGLMVFMSLFDIVMETEPRSTS